MIKTVKQKYINMYYRWAKCMQKLKGGCSISTSQQKHSIGANINESSPDFLEGRKHPPHFRVNSIKQGKIGNCH